MTTSLENSCNGDYFLPFTLRTSQSPGSGKRHLLHLARPQDRSGGPTKGAK
ncbi:MAG: hypothetical protein ACHBN1_13075 [Heteroscytonema crispum UTEX LB 1556]